MSIFDDIWAAFTGKQDNRTNEDKLKDLESEATEAEKLRDDTKKAWELKDRVKTANAEREKIINAHTPKRKGLSRTQLIIFAGLALILVIILLRSCH